MELAGKNVDWVMIVDILAGVDTDIQHMRYLNGAGCGYRGNKGNNGDGEGEEEDIAQSKVAVMV